MNFSDINSYTPTSNMTNAFVSFNNPSFNINNNQDKYNFRRYDEDNLRSKNKSHSHPASFAMKGYTTKGVGGEKTEDELSAVFYSPENINRIQKKIRQEIYDRTKGQYKLGTDQDETDLLVAMRAVFFEHARFLPSRIIHQVKELNRRTVEYVVPDMITSMKQSYDYIKEINQPIKPIPRPVNVNYAGRKTLPALTTTFGF